MHEGGGVCVPHIEYANLCSSPANDSMIMMAVAAARSSRRSQPLNERIDPETSMQKRSRLGCCCARPNIG
jgi:hypothetical protein